jgi:hypothetical protein
MPYYTYPHERGLSRFVVLNAEGARLAYLDAQGTASAQNKATFKGYPWAQVIPIGDYITHGLQNAV